jgi:phosphonate transport system substrate-binding protein
VLLFIGLQTIFIGKSMFITHYFRAAVVAIVLTLLAACASPPAVKPAKLVLGVQATKPEETRAAWQPLVQDIGKKHGIATELVTASQGDTVNALRDGKVDVVWLSSNVAIDAVIDAGAEAFALYHNVNGTKGYSAVLITRSDSGITKLDQAMTPGKYSYASGAKTSTSGYVLPQYFLFNKRGTTPEKLFKNVVYGGHFPNLDALWAKKVDVAINNTTDMAVFQTRTPSAKEGIRVLWTSPEVPNDVLMVRKNAPDAVKQAVKDIFLNYGKNSDTERELLKRASGISHFIPTNNRLLEPVSEFKFATERAAVQSNAALSTADRVAQLNNADQRAAAFKAALTEVK